MTAHPIQWHSPKPLWGRFGATAQAAAAHALNILVIDDHVLIRHALRGVLAQLKRQAITLEASDCAQAMRLLEQNHNVDLILLDLGAPDGGGSIWSRLRRRLGGWR